jgi:hypothetical protein
MTYTNKIDRVLTPKDRLHITKNINDKIIHGVLLSSGIKMTRASRPVYSVAESVHIKIELIIPEINEGKS